MSSTFGEFSITPTLTHPDWLALKRYCEDRHEGAKLPSVYSPLKPNEEATALILPKDRVTSYLQAEVVAKWAKHLITTPQLSFSTNYVLSGTICFIDDNGARTVITVIDNEVSLYETKSIRELYQRSLRSPLPAEKQWMLRLIAPMLGIPPAEIADTDTGESPF